MFILGAFMKFGDREDRVGIFRELAERKQQLGEEATRYPLDRAAYSELPLTDRMRIAERLVSRYSPKGDKAFYDRDQTPGSHRQRAEAEFEVEDHPGMLLKGRVVSAVQTSTGYRLNGLFVFAHAVDPVAKLRSRSIPYGALRGGDQMVINPDGNWDGRLVPMEDPAAANVVDMIDGAAVGLIEGVVREHRRYAAQQAMSDIPPTHRPAY